VRSSGPHLVPEERWFPQLHGKGLRSHTIQFRGSLPPAPDSRPSHNMGYVSRTVDIRGETRALHAVAGPTKVTNPALHRMPGPNKTFRERFTRCPAENGTRTEHCTPWPVGLRSCFGHFTPCSAGLGSCFGHCTSLPEKVGSLIAHYTSCPDALRSCAGHNTPEAPHAGPDPASRLERRHWMAGYSTPFRGPAFAGMTSEDSHCDLSATNDQKYRDPLTRVPQIVKGPNSQGSLTNRTENPCHLT
jgi:hypothetical protein